MAERRTDLNGRRFVYDGSIWFIDRGQRRRVPDPDTLRRLFANPDNQTDDPHLNLVEPGPDIDGEAVVVSDGRKTYFVDDGKKRWITSPAAMSKYGFRAEPNVPPILLRLITEGDNMS